MKTGLLQSTPPAIVAGFDLFGLFEDWVFLMMGITLQNWVYILTIIYLLMQMSTWVYKSIRRLKGRNVKKLESAAAHYSLKNRGTDEN